MKRFFPIMLFLFSINSFAQYVYPEKENADIVIQNTLAIQLLDEDDEFGKEANIALKEIFNENWKLTDVVFLSKAEIQRLKAAKETKYAYLTHDEAMLKEMRVSQKKPDANSTTFGKRYGMGLDAPGQTISFKRVAFTFAYYNYNLEIIGKKKPISVTNIGFANGELSKIDYLFLEQQLSQLLKSASDGISQKEYYDIEKNITTIESSQLILPQDLFSEKDIAKMNSFYDHEFEVVGPEKYQKVILTKESGKSYVKIIWSNQHNMYVWVVVNAEDGSILAQTGFGGVKFGKNHTANDIIKAKHLKYSTSKMAQKVNSRY